MMVAKRQYIASRASFRTTGFTLLLLTGLVQAAPLTERVSINSNGEEAEGGASESPSISADGRFVAFTSNAYNLAEEATPYYRHIYVHDRDTGDTTLVSKTTDGTVGSYSSEHPSISSDGRFVAFHSYISPKYQIFVYDRETKTRTLVSRASNGTTGNDSSKNPIISGNGRFVVFVSLANNLVENDSNNIPDIFVHDRETGVTRRINVASDGTQSTVAPGDSELVWDRAVYSISDDGQYVVFDSSDGGLVDNDTNEVSDVFLHDRQTATTERISVTAGGGEGDKYARFGRISGDGGYVAFMTLSHLLGDGTGGVFVHDRVSKELTRVSLNSDGTIISALSVPYGISYDGRYVSFASAWTYDYTYLFVHDRADGLTTQVNVAHDGSQDYGHLLSKPSISASGQFVAFASDGENLVPGDLNAKTDVFVNDYFLTKETIISGDGSVDDEDADTSGGVGDDTVDGETVELDVTNTGGGGVMGSGLLIMLCLSVMARRRRHGSIFG